MRRLARVAAVMAGLLVATACGDDATPSVLEPKGDEARRLADVWWLLLVLAVAVYVVVATLIGVAARRGRRTEAGKPSRLRDDAFILAGGVLAPAAVLAVLAVVTVSTTDELRAEQPGALRIEIEGADWWWDVRYPDTGVVTANEVRVPVGRPLEIGLTSRDVIHSFWVPQLAGKVDMVPGQRNVLRFTVEKAGVYRGECAEFCGIQHAHMTMVVVAEPAADFDRWLARRQQPPAEPDGLAAEGRDVFEQSSCAGCHTIRGTSAQGDFGPDLSDFGGRRTIGAGTVPNTRGWLAGWIVDAQSIKPGNNMPPLSLTPGELAAVIAYLESLR